ncbi:MAG: YitT family protein [Nakamurella sp.]
MSAPTTPMATAGSTLPDAPRHTLVEDVLGMLTGTLLASFGLFLLKATAAVTGGTAGVALLLSYLAPLPFGVVFFLVNVPFFALALWKKGIAFTVRTAIAVGLVGVFSALHPLAVSLDGLNPVYAVLLGNLMIGVGLLILFRHRASLGGFSILALILQERLGWRAGYVQMTLDVTVVTAALSVVTPLSVLLSAAGAILLNLVLALNHRPGRYLGL